MAIKRVAVVGAGVAGLGCARKLHLSGLDVTVFEKSNALGGRCATRRVGPYTFDTGATSIAPRGLQLEHALLYELSQENLVLIGQPVWTMAMGRTSPGDVGKAGVARYTYRTGINQIGKLLAQSLDVKFDVRIENLCPSGDGWRVGEEHFDALVLTAPTPQTQALLQSAGLNHFNTQPRYRATLSVLLGYAVALHPLPYHALIEPEQRSPVVWISVESQKSPDRAPEGHSAFVLQFGAAFSRDHYDDSDAEIAREAVVALTRLYGPAFDEPAAASVKRWRYAQPEQITTFSTINDAPHSLFVAGDGIAGPRVELAYESGCDIARRILERC